MPTDANRNTEEQKRLLEALSAAVEDESLARHIDGVPKASEMVADMVTEHTMTAAVGPDGVLALGISVWPANSLADEVNHFYPGATVDEFGMVSGGWPTEQDLIDNRRPGGAVPSRRFSRWVRGLRSKP